jgi:2-polyprenyl-6-hydroxyphenyl methylase/3-demethylubiquinone-9 3-methyltransferase
MQDSTVSRIVRRLVDAQIALSTRFDRALLPPDYRIDGDTSFEAEFLTPHLYRGATVIDVGSGKLPSLSPAQRAALEITVVGFDVSKSELDAAPAGSYDATICADVTEFVGDGKADLAICSSLLEHVPDVDKALRGIASMLKPGGEALVFIPCGNTLFARLNRLLPQKFKQKLLNCLFPKIAPGLGFPVHYDRCTPRQIARLAENNGLVPEKIRLYLYTGYFEFFTPVHVLWRLWQVGFRKLVDAEASESFSMALRDSPISPKDATDERAIRFATPRIYLTMAA